MNEYTQTYKHTWAALWVRVIPRHLYLNSPSKGIENVQRLYDTDEIVGVARYIHAHVHTTLVQRISTRQRDCQPTSTNLGSQGWAPPEGGLYPLLDQDKSVCLPEQAVGCDVV